MVTCPVKMKKEMSQLSLSQLSPFGKINARQTAIIEDYAYLCALKLKEAEDAITHGTVRAPLPHHHVW